MDDPRPRLPEADPVLLRGRVEELVDLVVLGHRPAHVLRRARLRADQVVAVDRRGHRNPGLVRLHELEQRHLAGRVLHRHAVDAEPEGGRAPLPGLGTPVVDVGDQDLLAERERAVPVAAGPGETLRHRSVEGANRVDHGRAPQSNRLPPSRTGGALHRAHMLLPSTQSVKPGSGLDFDFLVRAPSAPARRLLGGMARRPRVFGPGLLYHVIARGNQPGDGFLGHADYETYLHRLAVYRARYAVTLHAYCLMPNHVHLVARHGEAPLDRFMQCLQQSYTQRFNRRYGQVGHVFQGRYKAILCDDGRVPRHPRSIRPPEPRASRPRGPRRRTTATAATERISAELAHRARRSDLRAEPGRRHGRLPPARRRATRWTTSRWRPAGSRGHPGPRGHPSRRRSAALARGLSWPRRGAPRAGPRGARRARQRALAAYVLVRRLGYRLTDVAAVLGRNLATTSVAVGRVGRRPPEDETAARQGRAAGRVCS